MTILQRNTTKSKYFNGKIENIFATMLHYSDNILYIRELTGLSQTEFGEIFSASKDMIHSYEAGRAKPPLKIVNPLAEMLEMEPEKFAAVKLRSTLKDEGKMRVRSWFAMEQTKRQFAHLKHNPTLPAQIEQSQADLKDKLIRSLETEIERLQKDLELSLGELRHNALLTRAIAETNQELLIEILGGKNKKALDELAYRASTRNGEKYEKMKGEGNFAYVGK
jgi:DNA-binding transcriptional regulator YiaG